MTALSQGTPVAVFHRGRFVDATVREVSGGRARVQFTDGNHRSVALTVERARLRRSNR